MAGSSVLPEIRFEPICTLYRLTKDKRYLAFAQQIVVNWEQPNGPRIVSSLLSTGSVFRTANAKAYEMMSCLVGLVELYRATGEERFLNAAKAAWDDIAAKRLYITGATSAHERPLLEGGRPDRDRHGHHDARARHAHTPGRASEAAAIPVKSRYSAVRRCWRWN